MHCLKDAKEGAMGVCPSKGPILQIIIRSKMVENPYINKCFV